MYTVLGPSEGTKLNAPAKISQITLFSTPEVPTPSRPTSASSDGVACAGGFGRAALPSGIWLLHVSEFLKACHGLRIGSDPATSLSFHPTQLPVFTAEALRESLLGLGPGICCHGAAEVLSPPSLATRYT